MNKLLQTYSVSSYAKFCFSWQAQCYIALRVVKQDIHKISRAFHVLMCLLCRGDRVELLVGKDKGKQGLVNYMVEERNWVMVEGLNCDYTTVGKTK